MLNSLRVLDENNPFDFSEFKNLLGLFGNVLAIVFFLSPITIMRRLHKKELKPIDTPYILFLSSALNNILWVSYGILKTKDKFFIILCNGIGLPMNVIYYCLYLYYLKERKCTRSILLMLLWILFCGAFFSIFTFAIGIEAVSQYSACFFNVILYGAPGQKIVKSLFFLLKIFSLFFFIFI